MRKLTPALCMILVSLSQTLAAQDGERLALEIVRNDRTQMLAMGTSRLELKRLEKKGNQSCANFQKAFDENDVPGIEQNKDNFNNYIDQWVILAEEADRKASRIHPQSG